MSVSVRAGERPDPRPAGILGAAIGATLLFSAALALPILWLVATVSPFPLIVQRLRSGLGGALTAALVSTAIVGVVFSPGHALAFLMLLAGPGLLIGEAMARGRGLLRGCGWAFALLAVEIGLMLLFAGPWMASHLLKPIELYRSQEFLTWMRSNGTPPEKVDEWAEQFSSLHRVMEVVYPAVFIISGALIVLANASLLRAYLVRRDPGWLEGGEFEGIRWPWGLAVVFVLAGPSVVVPLLRPAGYNVLLVLAFFFALQGLAVVAYYAHRLAGPPFLRIGLLVLVLVNPWAPQILALLGLFDNWFDFRKWAEPPESVGQ